MNELWMVLVTNSADASYGVDTWSYVIGIFDTRKQAEIARDAEVDVAVVNGINMEVIRYPEGRVSICDPNDGAEATIDIISIPLNKQLDKPICVGGDTYYE